jgi:SAM-dependent methyltransferase
MQVYSPLIYDFDERIKESALKSFGSVLDLGCGSRKFPNSVGVDKIENGEADIIWDLNKYPWPLQDNSFDLIVLHHFLEHADDVVKTMEEIYRVGKPGARVLIQVPFFRNLDALTDITHKHFFTLHSIDYFIEGSKVFNYHYSKAKFELAGKWLGWPGRSRNFIRGLAKWFINKISRFYEKYLSVVYPVKNIAWELIIKK